MTIDPLTIPCAYCQNTCTGLADDDDSIIHCDYCEISVPVTEWTKVGIYVLAGRLAEKGFYFAYGEDDEKNQDWMWVDDRINYDLHFSTFEEAVLDAWEYLERKKHEHRP